MVADGSSIIDELHTALPDAIVAVQAVRDNMPTVWVQKDRVLDVLKHLKSSSPQPFGTLFDLTAIDERVRSHRDGQPSSDFTVVYHLISYARNEDVRVKVALTGDTPSLTSIVNLWPSANWYEREIWDMFGVRFEGHPHLRRILLPTHWQGHPLRKEHPARATEMGQFQLPEERAEEEDARLQFRPEEWGLPDYGPDAKYVFLNMGPQHPGTHGPFRIVLALDGEAIVDAIPDIGFHHRGAEKMAERQTWHTFIPYTDRIDYLGGVMNNLPYCLAVEKLAGIKVPDKAQVIRVMMAEFFRIASHLVWYGTYAQDVGGMSPVFFMFNDRERVFSIVEAICGGRMHPSWFRIGGVAHDLPNGWDKPVEEFVKYFPSRLDEFLKLVMQNRLLKARTKGIGAYTLEEAIEWGATGPGLRACGLEWDIRKNRPYSGYDQFNFDVPTAHNGDAYDRGIVRVEELRQSLRIIEQCLNMMPDGPYMADHPLATPPPKQLTTHHIETLIHHFLNVTWGPVIPHGEAAAVVEATKGNNSYYLISDGGTGSYRTRIRTPSFAHLQMIPLIIRGSAVADLIALLGSIDFVMADVDR